MQPSKISENNGNSSTIHAHINTSGYDKVLTRNKFNTDTNSSTQADNRITTTPVTTSLLANSKDNSNINNSQFSPRHNKDLAPENYNLHHPIRSNNEVERRKSFIENCQDDINHQQHSTAASNTKQYFQEQHNNTTIDTTPDLNNNQDKYEQSSQRSTIESLRLQVQPLSSNQQNHQPQRQQPYSTDGAIQQPSQYHNIQPQTQQTVDFHQTKEPTLQQQQQQIKNIFSQQQPSASPNRIVSKMTTSPVRTTASPRNGLIYAPPTSAGGGNINRNSNNGTPISILDQGYRSRIAAPFSPPPRNTTAISSRRQQQQQQNTQRSQNQNYQAFLSSQQQQQHSNLLNSYNNNNNNNNTKNANVNNSTNSNNNNINTEISQSTYLNQINETNLNIEGENDDNNNLIIPLLPSVFDEINNGDAPPAEEDAIHQTTTIGNVADFFHNTPRNNINNVHSGNNAIGHLPRHGQHISSSLSIASNKADNITTTNNNNNNVDKGIALNIQNSNKHEIISPTRSTTSYTNNNTQRQIQQPRSYSPFRSKYEINNTIHKTLKSVGHNPSSATGEITESRSITTISTTTLKPHQHQKVSNNINNHNNSNNYDHYELDDNYLFDDNFTNSYNNMQPKTPNTALSTYSAHTTTSTVITTTRQHQHIIRPTSRGSLGGGGTRSPHNNNNSTLISPTHYNHHQQQQQQLPQYSPLNSSIARLNRGGGNITALPTTPLSLRSTLSSNNTHSVFSPNGNHHTNISLTTTAQRAGTIIDPTTLKPLTSPLSGKVPNQRDLIQACILDEMNLPYEDIARLHRQQCGLQYLVDHQKQKEQEEKNKDQQHNNNNDNNTTTSDDESNTFNSSNPTQAHRLEEVKSPQQDHHTRRRGHRTENRQQQQVLMMGNSSSTNSSPSGNDTDNVMHSRRYNSISSVSDDDDSNNNNNNNREVVIPFRFEDFTMFRTTQEQTDQNVTTNNDLINTHNNYQTQNLSTSMNDNSSQDQTIPQQNQQEMDNNSTGTSQSVTLSSTISRTQSRSFNQPIRSSLLRRRQSNTSTLSGNSNNSNNNNNNNNNNPQTNPLSSRLWTSGNANVGGGLFASARDILRSNPTRTTPTPIATTNNPSISRNNSNGATQSILSRPQSSSRPFRPLTIMSPHIQQQSQQPQNSQLSQQQVFSPNNNTLPPRHTHNTASNTSMFVTGSALLRQSQQQDQQQQSQQQNILSSQFASPQRNNNNNNNNNGSTRNIGLVSPLELQPQSSAQASSSLLLLSRKTNSSLFSPLGPALSQTNTTTVKTSGTRDDEMKEKKKRVVELFIPPNKEQSLKIYQFNNNNNNSDINTNQFIIDSSHHHHHHHNHINQSTTSRFSPYHTLTTNDQQQNSQLSSRQTPLGGGLGSSGPNTCITSPPLSTSLQSRNKRIHHINHHNRAQQNQFIQPTRGHRVYNKPIVLDEPYLMDDYYTSIIDWHRKYNYVAVGLQDTIKVYNMNHIIKNGNNSTITNTGDDTHIQNNPQSSLYYRTIKKQMKLPLHYTQPITTIKLAHLTTKLSNRFFDITSLVWVDNFNHNTIVDNSNNNIINDNNSSSDDNLCIAVGTRYGDIFLIDVNTQSVKSCYLAQHANRIGSLAYCGAQNLPSIPRIIPNKNNNKMAKKTKSTNNDSSFFDNDEDDDDDDSEEDFDLYDIADDDDIYSILPSNITSTQYHPNAIHPTLSQRPGGNNRSSSGGNNSPYYQSLPLLASGGKDGKLLLFDVRCKNRLFCINNDTHRVEIVGLKWSYDGLTLATGCNDNNVRTFDLFGQKKTFKHHTAAVRALSWSPFDCQYLASGGGTNDRKICIWDTSKPSYPQSSSALTNKIDNTDMNLTSTTSLKQATMSILLGDNHNSNTSNNSNCSNNNNNSNALYNVIDCGNQICNLLWSKRYYNEVISAQGYSQNRIQIYDLLTLPAQPISSSSTSSINNNVGLNNNNNNNSCIITGHKSRPIHIALDPTGCYLLSASGDKTIRITQIDQ